MIDPDCGPGRICSAGICVDAPMEDDAGIGTGELGSPCAADGECTSGYCLPPGRGGVCSTPCATPNDCIASVPFGAACSAVSHGGGIETACIPFVASGSPLGHQCAADSTCESSTCVEAQCTEACASVDDCILGQSCTNVPWGGGTFRGCGYDPGSGVVEIDLGDHDIRAAFGTGDLEFAIPPDAVSVTLRARRIGGDPLGVSFYEVHNPRDEMIYDVGEFFMLRDTPERWWAASDDEAIAMLVPNGTTDRIAFYTGRHTFSLLALRRTMDDMGTTRVHASALVKRGGTSGAIDLNVFLVGVGITAAAAPTSTRVQNALNRFRTIMAPAGITLGDVQFIDVGGADATTYQVIDTTMGASSELAGLFRLSAGRTGHRVNVFLVRSVMGGSGFNTLGIAGGIPGATSMHGTAHSGVVVSFDSGVISGTGAGHVMAHEISHFLGLYHVTERERPCGASEMPPGCSPFGGTDTIGDTTRGDDTNLMHWAIVGMGSNTGISTGQSYVLGRSPLVR
jgi:hypothetical protein